MNLSPYIRLLVEDSKKVNRFVDGIAFRLNVSVDENTTTAKLGNMESSNNFGYIAGLTSSGHDSIPQAFDGMPRFVPSGEVSMATPDTIKNILIAHKVVSALSCTVKEKRKLSAARSTILGNLEDDVLGLLGFGWLSKGGLYGRALVTFEPIAKAYLDSVRSYASKIRQAEQQAANNKALQTDAQRTAAIKILIDSGVSHVVANSLSPEVACSEARNILVAQKEASMGAEFGQKKYDDEDHRYYEAIDAHWDGKDFVVGIYREYC